VSVLGRHDQPPTVSLNSDLIRSVLAHVKRRLRAFNSSQSMPIAKSALHLQIVSRVLSFTEWWGAQALAWLSVWSKVQLMPLPLTVSCFSKIHIGFTFLVPAHPGSPGQRAVKRVCVCVCVVFTAHVLCLSDSPKFVENLPMSGV